MYNHGPSCLQGPITSTREWWMQMESDDKMNPQVSAPRHGLYEAHSGARDIADRPIRTELVERVRREIAEGTYDTPEKFEIALDRLLRRLEQE